MKPFEVDRRLVTRALTGAGALSLGACDQIAQSPAVMKALNSAETLTRTAQRLILTPGQLAPEFKAADISPVFKPNGSTDVDDDDYRDQADKGFADYRLEVGGLVDRPLKLSLADLRDRPGRTQITRHDCVEGWSCIGQWTGARLGPILKAAGVKAHAKYVVFHCLDTIDTDNDVKYYESIGMADAFHPQTILAYALNGKPLPVANGAPLRLRVERQLGYKQAKYIQSIQLVDSLKPIGGGKGGYWEDSTNYEWYGGI